jgi:hypothetical protein
MNLTMQSRSLAHEGGWTVLRREVINDTAGICARCGMAGADTATPGWDGADLAAAHTRCVVGLDPPTVMRVGAPGLLAGVTPPGCTEHLPAVFMLVQSTGGVPNLGDPTGVLRAPGAYQRASRPEALL